MSLFYLEAVHYLWYRRSMLSHRAVPNVYSSDDVISTVLPTIAIAIPSTVMVPIFFISHRYRPYLLRRYGRGTTVVLLVSRPYRAGCYIPVLPVLGVRRAVLADHSFSFSVRLLLLLLYRRRSSSSILVIFSFIFVVRPVGNFVLMMK